MKTYFLRFYNFLRDTSLILVILLLGGVYYLAGHPAQEQSVMASMGYEVLDIEAPVLGIASISSIEWEKEKPLVLDVPRGMGYIQLSDIHFVTMDDGKPLVVLKSNDTLSSSLTLSRLYEQFDVLLPESFFKMKSEIFPIAQILSVTSEPIKYKNSSNTQYTVTLKGGISFPISKPKFDELKERLKSL